MKRSTLALLSLLVALTLAFSAFGTTQAQTTSDQGTAKGKAEISGAYVPGQFVVKFKAGVTDVSRTEAVSALSGRFFDSIPSLGADAVEFASIARNPTTDATLAIMNKLKQNPNVEYVEPNYIYKADFTPNDPSLSQQYGWTNTQAYQAWDVWQGSSSTVIAVVDTGIQRTHPDLDAKIVAGYDYVDNDTAPDDGNGHGSHVAGTSAAETNNSTGGAGMCPNCSLMPVRVLDNAGSGTLVNVANGIGYASSHGAKVINMSLGGGGSTTLQNAVDSAWNNGVFMACAAGNDGTNSQANAYPGAYANCFAVAATTNTDAKAS
ncbi:MAG: S8 family serine peptidase, partial [Chloroflexia bacterium]